MATLRRDGRWQASLGSGRNRRAFYGATEAEAEEKKAKHVPPRIQPLQEGTLDSFVFHVWFPRVVATTKPPTQRRYKDLYDIHVMPRLGHRQIADLRLEDIQSWLNDKSDELSAKSLSLLRGVVHNILSLAERTGRVERNECRWAHVKAGPRKKKRKDLNLGVVRKLLAAAKGTPWEGPCWAAAYLGLRRGEVCGLQIGDVEDDRVVLRRTRAKGYTGPLKGRAEGDEAAIPVPKGVAEKLRSFAGDAVYLFCNTKGRPITPDRWTEAMAELCKKAKVPKMGPHDLRAACASNLRSLGVPVATIMAVLRHTSLAMTELYLDDRDDEQREALGRLME